MTAFRFRLAKVLDWYEKQSRLEAERLRLFAALAIQTQGEIETQRKDLLARQMEVLSAPHPDAGELASLGPFLRRGKREEQRLLQKLQKNEQDVARQRAVSQEARRRLRLVEKLRERQLAEFDYEASRELEELASETYLARFARALNETPAA